MLVVINHRLLQNLTREYGRAVSPREAEQLLIDAGFTPDEPDRWIVDEEDLGHLNPDEVSAVEVLEAVRPKRSATRDRPRDSER
jgi:hypothetical protein